jgi:Histidine phosphatase superfamily (branch 1)
MTHFRRWLRRTVIAGLCVHSLLAGAQTKDLILPPPISVGSKFHIVFVRHAYPACSDLQCNLNDEGHRQAKELSRFIDTAQTADVAIVGIYASSACRTVLTVAPTANQFDLTVRAFPARAGMPICGFLGDGDDLERPAPSLLPSAGIAYAEAATKSRQALYEKLADDALTCPKFCVHRPKLM